MARRFGAVVTALTLGVAWQWIAAPSGAAQPPPPEFPPPSAMCTVTDPSLDELSGLDSDGESWFVTGDGGTSLSVAMLDPRDCSVRDERTAPADPYDVEDLALGADGEVWLADTGDNQRKRETAAVHVLYPDGRSALHRLTYPDGPHDAEAMLLDGRGVPHVVTKEPLGEAGVYRPAEPLVDGETVPLERVGSVRLGPTTTPGGPVEGSIASAVVTGGAVSADGRTVALRTYTDAYVFPAPEGDVVAALARRPLRVPLPDEPQGEAVAFEPDGALLSASEGSQPVRMVPGVEQAASGEAGPPSDATGDEEPPPAEHAGEPESNANTTGQNLAIAAVFAALIMYFGGKLARLRS
ncbi:hypothetical protein GIY23_07915 [Allosaccharopolyspora coralli]|uniref:Esterase-like activity of phytase family protein n=1 Tax=Allosaccharopolyspora coralli TaxID=2665642 RepID=A0A5Q3QCD7_9PSEU|nr:hypothetical protein GIY23_07915 [Allosaccharopolyspora coralli]